MSRQSSTRNVHFGASHYPSSPSATSSSSIASSPGPLTPPQFVYDTSHYASFRAELPPVATQLHPKLDQSSSKLFSYNVSTYDAFTKLPSSVLAESATNPPVRVMTFYSRQLPWKMEVVASSQGYVTVLDVLTRLQTYMHTPVSSQELARELPEIQRSVQARFQARVSLGRHRDCLRRVDYIAARPWFIGIIPWGKEGQWEICFSSSHRS